MPIKPKSDIILPRKVFDKRWMKEIHIEAQEVGGEARAKILLVPYNNLGEMDYSNQKAIVIEDILGAIALGDRRLTKAFSAIQDVVQAKIDEGA